jgi:hypothetical protein
MKKTIYFTGTATLASNLEAAIKAVTDKRDKWLNEYGATIGKIDNEDLKIVQWFIPNQAHVIVTIQLTYFPK